MLDQVLAVFKVKPEYDLDLMRPGQSLLQSTSRILGGLEDVMAAARPDLVVVQGDTTSTFCGALAAFYQHVPVAHIEAGLRTGDLLQPFPEEANRVLTGRLAALHFTATPWAAGNLRAEGVRDESIHVTGNTGIDAVLHIRDALASGKLTAAPHDFLDPNRKLILVTAHRRESFGDGLQRICNALARIATREDVQIVYPVHPNPNVRGPVAERLGSFRNVHLINPLGYVDFVDLMQRSYILITDSGGVQEEGPSLGKPILVLREKTERPEAVEAGTVTLVGTDEDRIVSEAVRMLDDHDSYAARTRIHNPYGDGHASSRISALIRTFLTR